jgi:type I pantothenate kinase
MPLSPYLNFSRAHWSRLRATTPLTLSEADLMRLRGTNEEISLREVEAIYLPLSRLLNLYVAAKQSLHETKNGFLGNANHSAKVPYVIGIAGSVAVGKSTTARLLQALLAQWPHHPKVDLVTTDGFLFSNAVLEERGLMKRKGFPESYDRRALLSFIAKVKAGGKQVVAPIYSHLTYDILPNEHIVIRQPDIVILEGLNVLQTGVGQDNPVFVSDYFDFSIYVDAEEEHIKSWYVNRFLTLRRTAFSDPASYFHRYASLSDDEAVARAQSIWDEINGLNLRENILPTRGRAHLILHKGQNHAVESVKLRKL